jgi:hypothetical protein
MLAALLEQENGVDPVAPAPVLPAAGSNGVFPAAAGATLPPGRGRGHG